MRGRDPRKSGSVIHPIGHEVKARPQRDLWGAFNPFALSELDLAKRPGIGTAHSFLHRHRLRCGQSPDPRCLRPIGEPNCDDEPGPRFGNRALSGNKAPGGNLYPGSGARLERLTRDLVRQRRRQPVAVHGLAWHRKGRFRSPSAGWRWCPVRPHGWNRRSVCLSKTRASRGPKLLRFGPTRDRHLRWPFNIHRARLVLAFSKSADRSRGARQ